MAAFQAGPYEYTVPPLFCSPLDTGTGYLVVNYKPKIDKVLYTEQKPPERYEG